MLYIISLIQCPLHAVYYRVFRSVYYRQALAIITPYIAPFRAVPFRRIRAASCGVLPRCPDGVHLYALHRGNVAAACGVLAVYIRGGLAFFSRPKRRTCGEWQRLYILLYPLRTNILYILYATEYIRYARLRFACKRTFRTQTEGTGRRVCRPGVHPTACGVLRRCAWRVATSGAHPSTQAGHPPPVGAPSQGTPPFSDFFLFFLRGSA